MIFLGNELAEDLFGTVECVGKILMVNRVPYTVIGVMKEKMQMGTYGGPDAHNSVIPETTFKAQFGRDRLNVFVVHPKESGGMQAAIKEFHEVLARKYGFDPDDPEVFGVWDTVRGAETFNNVMLGIKIFLGIIGALTLVIGGVGVANIMYAVVKERTKEIGVMMALGARRSWILGTILLEGGLFTFVGGILGIIMATAVVAGLNLVPTDGNTSTQYLFRPTISIEIGLAISCILGAIGVLAGFFPARRAASIQPAETLRYE